MHRAATVLLLVILALAIVAPPAEACLECVALGLGQGRRCRRLSLVEAQRGIGLDRLPHHICLRRRLLFQLL